MKIVVLLISVMLGVFTLWRSGGEKPLRSLENPRIVINKGERKLKLFDGEKFIKIYKMALGFEPTGDKIKRDDGRTPEGEYFVSVKNLKSKFHRSLGINYPNVKDAERGLRDKLISQIEYDAIILANNEKRLPPQDTALGSEIYIHGGGILWDWTWGCVALENKEIEKLFEIIPVGTAVLIEP
jgi:murein L,D-transpeptidase YafK